jgi:hypothetical protein
VTDEQPGAQRANQAAGACCSWRRVPPRARPAFCKTNADGCDEYISAVHISAFLNDTATYCHPKSATDSQANLKAVFRDVRTWIAAHPETFDRPTSDSVRAACVALYPCRHYLTVRSIGDACSIHVTLAAA